MPKILLAPLKDRQNQLSSTGQARGTADCKRTSRKPRPGRSAKYHLTGQAPLLRS